MSATPHEGRFLTEAQFCALPKSTQKTELLDGEVFVSPSPSNAHQILVGNLFRALSDWADDHPPAFCGLSPFDIRLAANRVVQPDLFLFVDGLAEGNELVRRAPHLIIEVLSSNRAYDTLMKRFVYQQAGVGEYWMVDGLHKRVQVVRGAELRAFTDRVHSEVAPGFEVDLPALFSRLP